MLWWFGGPRIPLYSREEAGRLNYDTVGSPVTLTVGLLQGSNGVARRYVANHAPRATAAIVEEFVERMEIRVQPIRNIRERSRPHRA
ncbi:MAG: hypothetical protein HYW25_03820 [Candidatus Aenigmarchaeota archaeon]|nr:hypothetical protein [Candidatus Aenigmarchaeota archaeon]